MAATPEQPPFDALRQAEADYLAGREDAALRTLESLPEPHPDASRLLALCRLREVLTNWPPGAAFAPTPLRAALTDPAADPRLEADRLFALGWLHWLAGEPESADALLTQAVTRLSDAAPAHRVEAAYWSARVRFLLNRPDAVAGFERVLRQGGAPPRATCWFVDLLWRAGHLDRAEQVWKTVRTNRKVTAADEAPLLEARVLLRHGEAGPAERVLGEAAPRGGVAQVERDLLLAWTLVAQGQPKHVPSLLAQAEAGPYPRAAVATWRALFDLRQGQDAAALPEPSQALAAFVAGQRGRVAGRHDEAVAALREALTGQPAQPFARYALACLGEGDFASVLAGQPGLFLAVRCRARLAVERFRARQAIPAELLDQLDRAASTGFRPADGEHWRRLAEALDRAGIAAGGLQALAQPVSGQSDAELRDCLRAAVEIAARRLPPPAALTLLADWSRLDAVRADPSLCQALGSHLLRLQLAAVRLNPRAADSAEKALAAAVSLLGGGPRVRLTRALLGLASEGAVAASAGGEPLLELWRVAQAPANWEALPEVPSSGRLRGLAQALRLQGAAERRDPETAAGIFADADAWRTFPSGPPRFALRAAAHLARMHAADPRLRSALAAWLSLWGLAALPSEARPLAVHAGLAAPDPHTAVPPEGAPPVRWLLHQAAQAVNRKRFGEALVWTRRALIQDPELASVPESAGVRAALPELEPLARAAALADAARFDPDQPPTAAELLVDAVALLDTDAQGKGVLDAAAAGDVQQARLGMADIARRPDLDPRLAHHLALLHHRAAVYFEARDLGESADPLWPLAWRCWLRLLATFAEDDFGPGAGGLLLGRLLAVHRERLGDLLARGRMEHARRHWDLVHSLPALAREHSEGLGRRLEEALARFRDELAAEYLTATREAMRYGDARAGWHADYDRGLAALRRLLSLDRDNVRLLTALVEVCSEWFFDCYNNEDGRGLWEGVDRFTPFALKLARLLESRPADLTARAALAEFYKYRGFIARDRDAKAALYREALRFNPANVNVRELLAELGPTEET